MSKHIAFVGKGGVGKTTLTTMMCRYLIENKKGSIMAVDADPNANLNEALGLPITTSVSDLIEDTKNAKSIPQGMSKDVFIQYKIQQSLVESKDIDLLVMGGPQGPGCYCYANNILKKNIEDFDSGYDYLIIDSEAGMEHISRGTIQDIDEMFIISDASARGVRTVKRIYELVNSLKTKVGKVRLIITKASDEIIQNLQSEIDATGVELTGYVPFDNMVLEYDAQSKPLFQLPADSALVKASFAIFDKINL